MSANFTVTCYDMCGELDSAAFGDDLDAAIARAIEWTEHYKGKVIEVCNLDCVDLGWPDGLTEDERERLEVALGEASGERHDMNERANADDIFARIAGGAAAEYEHGSAGKKTR